MENILFIKTTVQMPLMGLPVCTPIVNIDGNQIMISPGSQIQPNQYDQKWNITDIIAPNLFHHAGIAKAAQNYPQAKLWHSPGLDKKSPGIKWSQELNTNNWRYQDKLPMIALKGMPTVNEVIFFHKQSRSLLVTDLAFNMLNMKGLGSKVILGLFGTYNKFAVSRFFTKTISDKKAFEQSLTQIFDFDFDNIIVSHGEHVFGNGKKKLLDALKERNLKPI